MLGEEKTSSPKKLHLFYFNALVGAYLYTAHAPYTFAGLIRVGLSVRAHTIDLDGTDADTFAASCAAVEIYID